MKEISHGAALVGDSHYEIVSEVAELLTYSAFFG